MTLQVELGGSLFLGVWIEGKGRDFGMNSGASAAFENSCKRKRKSAFGALEDR